jgi:hypothetical protein
LLAVARIEPSLARALQLTERKYGGHYQRQAEPYGIMQKE